MSGRGIDSRQFSRLIFLVRFETRIGYKWDGKKRREKKGEGFLEDSFFFLLLKTWIGAWKMCNVSTKEISMKQDDAQFIFVSKNCSYDRYTFPSQFSLGNLRIEYIYIYCWTARLPFFERRIKSEHFTRSFWNVKDFNLDTRREARRTSRCDWRLGARCSSESWLAWIEARRKQAGFRLKIEKFAIVEEQICKIIDNIIYYPEMLTHIVEIVHQFSKGERINF